MNRSSQLPVLHERTATDPQTRTSADLPMVLHVRVVTEAGGGPDKTILNSPRFLRPLGYDAACAYLTSPDNGAFAALDERASAAGAAMIRVADRGPFDVRVIGSLLSICRRHRVAVWHGHDYKSNLLGLIVRRFWPMKLVTTVHGWVKFTRRTPLYYAIDRFCLRWYQQVICVSEDLYEQCLDIGVAKHRCQLVCNAIDHEEYVRRQAATDARQQLGLAPDRLLIGAVGRLSAEKGFADLLHAFHAVATQGFPVQLAIIGEGDERNRLSTLIARLGLRDQVRLIGFQNNVKPYYEAMDVFVLSSLREGLPNVVLEAMAMEVPIIATRIAGVPRLIRDNENGLLVPPADIASLTAALAQMVSDSPLRHRLATAARKTIEADYSFTRRMERIRAIYDRVLAQ